MFISLCSSCTYKESERYPRRYDSTSSNLTQCMASCNANPDCQAIEFANSTGECYYNDVGDNDTPDCRAIEFDKNGSKAECYHSKIKQTENYDWDPYNVSKHGAVEFDAYTKDPSKGELRMSC